MNQGLKNRVVLLLTLAFLFGVLTQSVRADYCSASGGCGGGSPGGEYISDVQVGGDGYGLDCDLRVLFT